MGPGESLIGDTRRDPGPVSGLSVETSVCVSAFICGSTACVHPSMLAGEELRGPIMSIPEMCLFSG